MSSIMRDGDDFIVDAELIGEIFGLSTDEVQARMRSGDITSVCEAGEAEDEGRWRLTFRHADKACRLVIDEKGTLLQRVSFAIRPPGETPASK